MTRNKPATKFDIVQLAKDANWPPIPVNGKEPNDWTLHKEQLAMVYNGSAIFMPV